MRSLLAIAVLPCAIYLCTLCAPLPVDSFETFSEAFSASVCCLFSFPARLDPFLSIYTQISMRARAMCSMDLVLVDVGSPLLKTFLALR